MEELARTFNLGLGLLLVVAPSHAEEVLSLVPGARRVGAVRREAPLKPRVELEHLAEVLARGRASLSLPEYLLAPRRRVGVLISGSGTNLQALLEHCLKGGSRAEVVLVLSNVGGVEGLRRAARAGVPAKVLPHREYPSREAFDQALNKALEDAGGWPEGLFNSCSWFWVVTRCCKHIHRRCFYNIM